jgi:hypothetical protein
MVRNSAHRLSRFNCPFVTAIARKGGLPKVRTVAHRLVVPSRRPTQRNTRAPMRYEIPQSIVRTNAPHSKTSTINRMPFFSYKYF